jgi:hypothetical protein
MEFKVTQSSDQEFFYGFIYFTNFFFSKICFWNLRKQNSKNEKCVLKVGLFNINYNK